MDSNPKVSVIIPTVGRPSLSRAVESALSQQLSGGWIEVIVVNDTGQPLDPTFDSVLADPRVRVLTTHRRRQAVARNTGAAVSQARAYLFLDDDDWLLPGGLCALVDVLDGSPTVVAAYGSTLVVGNLGHGDAELGLLNMGVDGNSAAQVLSGAVIPVGSLLCRSDAFWLAGGYPPYVPSEDIHLARRLSLLGDFIHTGAAVAAYYLGEGWRSTTDYEMALEYQRISREGILDKEGVFARLVASAHSSYWRARNVRAYAVSCYWNLKHRRPLKALSRLLHCAAMFGIGLPGAFRRDFCRGLVDTKPPGSVQLLLADAARKTANVHGSLSTQ